MMMQFLSSIGTLARRPATWLMTGALALVGCQQDQQAEVGPPVWQAERGVAVAQPEAELAAVRTERAPAAAELTAKPEREGDRLVYSLAYPTGERDTSAILLSMIAPEQVRVGESYSYTLRATNLTQVPLTNVEVFRVNTQALQQQGGPATRPAQQQQQQAWQIGALGAGQTVTNEFSAIADEEGTRQVCLAVNYEPTLCAALNVVNPELRITKEGPTDVLLCEPLTYRYAVTNVGTGVAQNVRVSDQLPDGLTTEDGQTTIQFDVGELPAGQTEDFTAQIKPTTTGQFTSRARAQYGAGEAFSSPVTTVVTQPNLELQISGAEWSYVGTPVTYQLVVANTGDAPARDTTLVLNAEGFVDAEETRDLGIIPPGEARRVTVTLESVAEGQARLIAAANAYCADQVQQTAVTDIRTISALLLETVDNNDPVQVGQTTTYQVVVENQGSGAANNVVITATLPEGMTFVEAEGVSDVQAEGRNLTFAPVQQLPPGEVAAWQVTARADQPGWKQFQLQMKSDEMRQPAREQEPTRLYQP